MVAQPPYAPPKYATPPQPYAVYSPQPQYTAQPALYGTDPVTGAPLSAEQAMWYAQYGTQTVAEQLTAQPQQSGVDPLTMSILMGGSGDMGGYGGMSGGIDATTLALLSGGDDDMALQMALMNGGYDPTGGAFMNPIPQV